MDGWMSGWVDGCVGSIFAHTAVVFVKVASVVHVMEFAGTCSAGGGNCGPGSGCLRPLTPAEFPSSVRGNKLLDPSEFIIIRP